MSFHDRTDAGRKLAEALEHLRGPGVVVLGLPRGGVPVAAEVARVLGAPLDVSIVRKMGVPGQPELAMGAVGETGTAVVNRAIVRRFRVTPEQVLDAQARARSEIRRLLRAWRPDRPPVDLTGRTAVLVDDGVATGATARAACRVARSQGAARIVLAAPVAAADAVTALDDVADAVVCLVRPPAFGAVGQFYDDFAPIRDDEVATLLERASADRTRA